MEIKAVIFDMDGVISHTNPHHSKAFEKVFAKRGLYPTEEEYAAHMYGKNNRYIFTHFLNREISESELNKLEEEKESLFREIYQDIVEPIDGLLPFLEDIYRQEKRIGVATSAPRANMDLIIDRLSIRSKFMSLLASEDVNTHKPDPEVYLRTADNLKVNPEDCLVFEDSASGVQAAINANMKVVGVLSSHHPTELPTCDFYIENYLDPQMDKIGEILNI